MTARTAGGDVLTLLQEQHELLARVAELAALQAGLIDQEATESLLENLSRRQQILARVSEIDGRVTLAVAALSVTDPQFALIEQRRAAVRELSQAILEQDRRDLAQLHLRRDGLARSLAQLSQGSAARGAYAPAVAASPSFQDRSA